MKEHCVILLRESLSRCSFTPSQVDKIVNMMKPVLPSLNVFIQHVNKVTQSAKKRDDEEKLKVTVRCVVHAHDDDVLCYMYTYMR
jgi:hypothetical protein